MSYFELTCVNHLCRWHAMKKGTVKPPQRCPRCGEHLNRHYSHAGDREA